MKIALIQRPPNLYRGRFAPTPSGTLHFGSLVTALASYLDAKFHQGVWLVRIEDIDPLREQLGASYDILKTLEAYGLYWDESVLYQSQQSALYHEVLNSLAVQQLSYSCQCTRAQIKAIGGVYQGHCRDQNLPLKNNAIRVKNQSYIYQYDDLIQGRVHCDQEQANEDFTLIRKDGLFAYQLAVVVDDIYQGITTVIRGCDLLEPTAKQLSLINMLDGSEPKYGHVPLAISKHGFKLSKQNKAPAIDLKNPQSSLISALLFLGQNPPEELILAKVDEIIIWAIEHWAIDKVPKQQKIMLD